MAGDVELAQAISYARDLKALYETARAREQELRQAQQQLQASYRQALRYAEDLKAVHSRLQQAVFQSLHVLANALEAKDPYTHGHSRRVASFSRQLALRMSRSHAEAHLVSQAGLLHDIGKIGVSEAVLRKPGKLTADEWAAMKSHPIVGEQIVAPLDFFTEGATLIRCHHERFDGSGYPDGLKGETIPLGGRIVAVADVYDALTSDRPYRQRLSTADALRLLDEMSGNGLDSVLVSAFVEGVSDGSLHAHV
jgi:HD-GYP domain-containing protein (c-di-GMP phosphodiesterase class II)